MLEIITKILLSICLIVIGIFNYKGNINSIHWYQRTKITEKTRIPYGKTMGTGSILIGVGLLVPAVLNEIFKNINFDFITIITLIIGIIILIYGQIKYNKGIF